VVTWAPCKVQSTHMGGSHEDCFGNCKGVREFNPIHHIVLDLRMALLWLSSSCFDWWSLLLLFHFFLQARCEIGNEAHASLSWRDSLEIFETIFLCVQLSILARSFGAKGCAPWYQVQQHSRGYILECKGVWLWVSQASRFWQESCYHTSNGHLWVNILHCITIWLCPIWAAAFWGLLWLKNFALLDS
jgi:hypothetical protein